MRLLPLSAAGLLAALAACMPGANIATQPTSAPMPPVEHRRAVVGDAYVLERKDGSRFTVTIKSVSTETVDLETSSGCKATLRRDAFAPDLAWTNCSGSSGTQTSKRVGASIFPLTLESTEAWDYSGTNTRGNSWASRRNCSVVGEVSVTVPAGTFDTYRVRCEDRWWVREWFVRADGVPVQIARTRKNGSDDRNRLRKLISYTPGDG